MVGAFILLIICGYNDLEETPAVFLAALWPIAIAAGLIALIFYLPIRIGRELRVW
jgi:hypothetical protein